jgi:hypothetical protein
VSKLGSFLARWVLNVRRLFQVLVGLTFLVLAAIGAGVAFSWWGLYSHAPSRMGLVRFGLVAGFTILLIIFGLYSFVKARSIK